MQKYLAVDSDIAFAESENAVWLEKRGIGMDRVNTMTEAIHLLLHNQHEDYLYIGINSDAVDYLPLLSALGEITDIPILLATRSFTVEKEAAAIANGADFYGRYHPTTEENITSVLTWVEKATRKTGRKLTTHNVMMYKDLLVLPHRYQRGVFVGNRNIEVTHQEFELLNLLMENRGRVLTYEQIYRNVWHHDYEDATPEILRNAVRRLREKLNINHHGLDYIGNVREAGYCFPNDIYY